MEIRLRNSDINVLLFFLPAMAALFFFINAFGHSDIQVGSYYNLIITIFLFVKIYPYDKYAVTTIAISLLVLAGFYFVLTKTKINESFSYLVLFYNIVFALRYLPVCNYADIDLKKFRKHLAIFVILFIVLYELSVPYAKNKNSDDEYYDVQRVYKEGFLISHAACYYLGVAGFFLYQLRWRILAVVAWLYVATLGARIGLLYVAIAIIIIIIKKAPQTYKLLVKFKYAITAVLITVISVIVNRVISKIGIEGLMVFTSGRSVFWLRAILQIGNDGFSVANLLGRGPKYSNLFNKLTFGTEIWMHNDFIDILFNLGILGLVVYLSAFYKYFKKANAMYFFFAFLFSAFLNGFLLYDALFIITLSTVFTKRDIAT